MPRDANAAPVFLKSLSLLRPVSDLVDVMCVTGSSILPSLLFSNLSRTSSKLLLLLSLAVEFAVRDIFVLVVVAALVLGSHLLENVDEDDDDEEVDDNDDRDEDVVDVLAVVALEDEEGGENGRGDVKAREVLVVVVVLAADDDENVEEVSEPIFL